MEVVEIPGGWRVVAGMQNGEAIVIDATSPRVKDGQVRGVLTVRRGAAVALQTVCNLTFHGGRAKILTALKAKGICVEDGVLIAMEQACRTPLPRRESAPAPDATPGRTLPLPALLAEVAALLTCYVVMPDAAVTAVALWIVHTWVIDAADVTPYLNITSPAKRCGKSRLLEVIERLVREPWWVVRPTEAVLFRKIERDRPTLLLDEADTVFHDKSSGTEGLRALLNAGNRRGVTVPRCVGDKQDLVNFPVFCAKAMAGIGRAVPDTVRDRSLGEVRLVRKKPGEKLPKLRAAILQREAAPTRAALTTWASPETITALRAAEPAVPEELHDRAQDGWEPLLAIADLAGGTWPARARGAARALHATDLERDTPGVRLLCAMRDVFDTTKADKLLTVELLRHLIERDGEPWGAWWGQALEKGDTRGPGFKLTGYLREFGITSKQVRTSEGNRKGYERADCEDAFARYASAPKPDPAPGSPSNDETTKQPLQNKGLLAGNDETGPEPVSSSEGAETLGAQGLFRRFVVEQGAGDAESLEEGDA